MTGATPIVDVPCEPVAGAAIRTAQATNAQPRDGRAALVFSSTACKPPHD